MVEAQSPGAGVEEGGPFQEEGAAEEVRNRAGVEVVEVQNLVEEEEAVVDIVQNRGRAGVAVAVEEEEQHLLVEAVVKVVVEVGVWELDGHCSVASVGTCRQSSLEIWGWRTERRTERRAACRWIPP